MMRLERKKKRDTDLVQAVSMKRKEPMKSRSSVLGFVVVASLLPSIALADWWNQEMIKNQVAYQISQVCGSVHIQCVATQYHNAGGAYWSMMQSTANQDCSLFTGGCNERDELVDDYYQVSLYFAWMAAYYGYDG